MSETAGLGLSREVSSLRARPHVDPTPASVAMTAGEPDAQTVALRAVGSTKAVLVGLVAIAAILRFSTLGLQNYWIDEAVTVGLLRLGFVEMLATIPHTESTPPLFYVLAWLWGQVFGTEEVGLRSLSALLGTAFVPLAYLAARDLVSPRVGLIAAGLAAVSAPLIWYSQEARAYSLLVLLAGLSMVYFARALRARRGALARWTLASIAALATHYFAVFLVVAEAAVLLWRLHPTRRLIAACSALALAGAALLPLAAFQGSRGNLKRVGATPLRERVESAAELFAAGQTGALIDGAALAVGVCVAVSLVLLLLASGTEERRAVAVPAFLGTAGLLVPFALAAVGFNYVIPRNLLPLWLPVAIVVATGLATRRRRPFAAVAAAGLFAVSLALVVGVASQPRLQRENVTALVLKDPFLRARRNAVRVFYRRVAAGRPATLAASCPPGYRVTLGTAVWLYSDRPVAGARTGRRSWATQAPRAPRGGDTLSVSVVCAGEARESRRGLTGSPGP